ncbi:MAG: thioredoxin domain-containing protein [Syntrophobacteraceae bacterium]
MDRDHVMIACGNCGTRNRVPKVRLGEHPKCGRCKTPVSLEHRFPDYAIGVNDQTFGKEVLAFPGLVAVYVWSQSCVYCKQLNPVMDRLAYENTGRVKFARVLLDQSPMTGAHYNATTLPSIIFFRRGREVDRITGAVPKEEIERHLRALL